MITTIKIENVELEVEYDIVEGDLAGPYINSTIDVLAVYVYGQDITDLLRNESMIEIEEETAKKVFDK